MGVRVYESSGFLDDQSMAADFESAPLLTFRMEAFTITIKMTGTPAGALKLQFSNDFTYNPAQLSADDWNDIPDSYQEITEEGTHSWTVRDRYKWVKVVYTRTSGNGTCDGTIFGVEDY